MISVKIEAHGAMLLPDDPDHYLKALAPQALPGLLRAIEPDAREVSMRPEVLSDTHLLNIRGAVAGLIPFNAFYTVTYPQEPRPHVNVELTHYKSKNLEVIGRFYVQPSGTHTRLGDGEVGENQFTVIHVE